MFSVRASNDASFMIKYLKDIKIGNVTVHITTTHVAMLVVSLVIIIGAIIARVIINKKDASDTPGTYQNIVELIIEMLGNQVNAIMGTNAHRFVNYITRYSYLF